MTDRQNDRRHQQGDRTRARLIASARAQFDAYGYAGATVRQIAGGAEMTTGAVFNHFPSKAAIYREVYGHQPISADQGRKLLLALHWALKMVDELDEFCRGPNAPDDCVATFATRRKFLSARSDALGALLEVGEAILSDHPPRHGPLEAILVGANGEILDRQPIINGLAALKAPRSCVAQIHYVSPNEAAKTLATVQARQYDAGDVIEADFRLVRLVMA